MTSGSSRPNSIQGGCALCVAASFRAWFARAPPEALRASDRLTERSHAEVAVAVTCAGIAVSAGPLCPERQFLPSSFFRQVRPSVDSLPDHNCALALTASLLRQFAQLAGADLGTDRAVQRQSASTASSQPLGSDNGGTAAVSSTTPSRRHYVRRSATEPTRARSVRSPMVAESAISDPAAFCHAYGTSTLIAGSLSPARRRARPER
jgi:hypothetical protein